jgi:hypothetical protein
MAWTDGPQGFDAVKKMGPAFLSRASPHERGMLVRRPSRPDRIQGGAADRRTNSARPIPIRSSKCSRVKEKSLDTMNLIQGGLKIRRLAGPAVV